MAHGAPESLETAAPKAEPLVRACLNKGKVKKTQGKPLRAGISGAAALGVLQKNNLKDLGGVFMSADDPDLPKGDYEPIIAGGPGHDSWFHASPAFLFEACVV